MRGGWKPPVQWEGRRKIFLGVSQMERWGVYRMDRNLEDWDNSKITDVKFGIAFESVMLLNLDCF